MDPSVNSNLREDDGHDDWDDVSGVAVHPAATAVLPSVLSSSLLPADAAAGSWASRVLPLLLLLRLVVVVGAGGSGGVAPEPVAVITSCVRCAILSTGWPLTLHKGTKHEHSENDHYSSQTS